MPSKYFHYLAPAALIFASGILQAQTSKGILSGIIRDTTGAVVSGVKGHRNKSRHARNS